MLYGEKNSMNILDFFVSRYQLGTRLSGHFPCTEVAIVKRFKLESMYGLPARTRKSGCYREVAISGDFAVFCTPYPSFLWLRALVQINTTYRLLSQLSASRLLTTL